MVVCYWKPAMSSFEGPGVAFDLSKCSKLSMDEKRELVYELSKCSHSASEMLQTWSRQEILQILCAEMGKERKYTGLTKLKIIENLLKIVSQKKLQRHEAATNPGSESSLAIGQRASKRPRKADHPSRLPVSASHGLSTNSENDLCNTRYCKNAACKAKISQEDAFCKRCSCCICFQYDDNKDPSLWLTCNSEPPFDGDSCGLSCHLECALRHEKCGISKGGLDGCFYCVSCQKVNELLRCWKKQLMMAKETRRVDILCYRISLSQKLLAGTRHYQKVYEIVEEAVKKLEADVGPLTGLPVKMARGIVNRLSSGPEVQRLCAAAVESLDLVLSKMPNSLSSDPMVKDSSLAAANLVRFENVCTSSLTIILGSEDPPMGNAVSYSLWHRRAEDTDHPEEPTCTVTAKTRFLLSGLCPATEYVFKVVCYDNSGDLGMCEVRCQMHSIEADVPNSKNLTAKRSQSRATNSSSLSDPSSVEDETNNVIPSINDKENTEDDCLAYCNNASRNVSAKSSNDVKDYPVTGQGCSSGNSACLLDGEHVTEKIDCIPDSDTSDQENKLSPEVQAVEETSTDNGSNTHVRTGMECVPFMGCSEAVLPITPCKIEEFKDVLGRKGRGKPSKKDLNGGSKQEEEPQAGSSSKKRTNGRQAEENSGNGDKEFEYYVKVIRWLECEGHIETTFRQKFLTWYSLRATLQEARIVRVFVDTLIDDPPSLAGQLVDTFSDTISSKRASVVPSGFCLKLWH